MGFRVASFAGGYTLLPFTRLGSEKYSLVHLTITGLKKINPTRFGQAMRALPISEIVQTTFN